MEKILTARKRERLIERHRKKHDKRICDRIKAVLLYDDRYSHRGLENPEIVEKLYTTLSEDKLDQLCR